MQIDNTDLVKAYIAGIIDGEGCIFIGTRYDKRNGRNRKYYAMSVIVSMKNKSAIDYISAYYGGKLSTKIAGGRDEYADRRYWRLVLCSRNALILLKDILPFLLVKRESAKYAIAFQEHVNVNKNDRARLAGDSGYFDTVYIEREKLFMQYRAAAETERESGLPDRIRCDSPLLQDDKL